VGLRWNPGEFDSLALVDAEPPSGGSRAAWVVAVGAFVAVLLLGTLAWATARFVVGAQALPCQYHEAREGTGFEKLHGWHIDDVQNSSPLHLAVRTRVDSSAEPGTVLRISRCNVPDGADAVGYVAVGP
jgi:hypothetical protein